MKNCPRNQKGLTFISIALILGLIAFFVLLILKIAPIYFEHYKVSSSLQSLQEHPGLVKQSKRNVKKLLMKRFDINAIEDADEDTITVTKQGNYLQVEVNYEVTKNIAGNLDVLVYFNDMIEVGSR